MKLFSKIADLFGSNVIHSIVSAVDKFVTTDEEKAKLKMEIQTIAFQHQTELAKLQLAEMESARNREIEINRSEHAHPLAKLVAPLLALGVSISCVILFAVLMFVDIPAEKKDIIVYMLGVMSGVLMTVFGYYFGNSDNNKNRFLNAKD